MCTKNGGGARHVQARALGLVHTILGAGRLGRIGRVIEVANQEWGSDLHR